MTDRMALTLSKETQELLRQIAEKNDATPSSLVAMLVRQRARQEGLLPPLVKTEAEKMETALAERNLGAVRAASKAMEKMGEAVAAGGAQPKGTMRKATRAVDRYNSEVKAAAEKPKNGTK